jgi:para-aminobenzoate synthetase component 1
MMAAVRVLAWPIGADVAPERVFRRLVARAHRLDLPPPAALTGDWFGSRAVLAPSVALHPVWDVAEAFAIPDRQPEITEAASGAVGGGWFGYLGYALTDPGHWTRELPPAAWGWASHVLRQDHDGVWWFETVTNDNPDLALRDELAVLVSATTDPPAAPWRAGRLHRSPAALYRKTVRACIEAIAAGEIFQANICTRFEADFQSPMGLPAGAAELFATGIANLRPARAAYLAGHWGAVASLSPELFLSRLGDIARSAPIKGTLPRRTPADDINASLLRQSPKDVAENVMIVDLVRNDLGRVATPGGITVPDLLQVHPAPGVWHLISTIQAQLREGTSNADLLAATFPPGSVTGAPKLRALEIIADLEQFPRETYCGTIGLASPTAGLQLNVAIRTIEFTPTRLWLGVGGGITADSNPTAEWQECLHKSAPLETLLADSPNSSP